jgi:hypothetical protein
MHIKIGKFEIGKKVGLLAVDNSEFAAMAQIVVDHFKPSVAVKHQEAFGNSLKNLILTDLNKGVKNVYVETDSMDGRPAFMLAKALEDAKIHPSQAAFPLNKDRMHIDVNKGQVLHRTGSYGKLQWCIPGLLRLLLFKPVFNPSIFYRLLVQ